jgi:signal transduction histidine kinase
MRGLSLRTKVFFLIAAALLVTVVPALVLIQRAVETGVYQRATQDLQGAATALQRNWALRDSLLLSEAEARAVAPGMESAWLEGDSRRINRVLSRGLDRDRVVFAADTTGLVLIGPQVDVARIRGALPAPRIIGFLDDEGRPTRLALAPVHTDSGVAGVAGVGTRLGSSTVSDLKKDLAGGTDLALVVGDSLVATTFADSIARELARAELEAWTGAQGTETRTVDGLPYLAAVHRLQTGGLDVSVVLFRPIADELTLARGIVQSMIGIGLTAIAIALAIALLVARIVARPAQALAAASTSLARGSYDAPLPRVSGDEIGQLARAFGEMRAAIAEREGRLRSAQAEMIHREKLAAMGRLVAQLSHEINNPIYNIQNCLEALARRGDPADPNREFLELAQEELQRMAALTRTLLDHSRPASDAAASLNLNGVVRRVLTLAGTELERRGIRVETELARDLPEVVAHPEAIHQVLANLVNNAGDASREGDVLRIVTRAVDDAVEVVVEDTGAGIAEEDLPHIFEAFYTTKPGIHGIGLGLFVSEGIVRGHRGRLLVESRLGEGSRFTVRLPRETLHEAVGAAEPQPALAGNDAG